MIFNHTCKQKAVSDSFLAFKMAGHNLYFVNDFK